MAKPQYSIDRAANGLVLTLFLACAIFLVVILFQVLGEVRERQVQSEVENVSSARVIEQLNPSPDARPTAPRQQV